MAAKNTTTTLETKVTTLEGKLAESTNTIQNLRNRVGELSDELTTVKNDLHNTREMITTDLKTIVERVTAKFNSLNR
jgi:peptidoglycan hydrolase CwlO-like protein